MSDRKVLRLPWFLGDQVLRPQQRRSSTANSSLEKVWFVGEPVAYQKNHQPKGADQGAWFLIYS